MFGADTALVFDAIQMLAVAATVTGGAVYLMMRRRPKAEQAVTAPSVSRDDLEERVRVLERIATDPATRLAEQFEALEKTESQGKENA